MTRQVEKIVTTVLKAQYKLKEDPEVRVNSHPVLVKLFFGRVDDIEVKAKDVKTSEEVTITDLSVSIKGLRIDLADWVRRRRLSVKDVDSVAVTVVLSEQEVNRYLTKLLPGSRVTLLDGKIRYRGKIGYLAGNMTMDLLGRFKLGPSNRLTFMPDPGEIEKLNVSQEVKQYLSEALVVDYALPELPGGFDITSVVVKPGKIVIKGEMTEFDFIREEI